MANRFGADLLIQAPDPQKAALFYVNHLGFEITDDNPKMIGLHGKHINLFIEPGPSLGPVLEVTAPILDEWLAARKRLRSPDMGNGWVGCDDGIGHAVERVFGKGEALHFCPS
jgi:catechol 2,3-dioxygenase-like lactoylglutathione lyase family enzyme